MPSVVPRHDAEATLGQQRREHIEGSGEVHAAVGEQDRRGILAPPLVYGDGNPVAVDRALTVRTARAGVGGGCCEGGHPLTLTAWSRRVQPGREPVSSVTDDIWTERPRA